MPENLSSQLEEYLPQQILKLVKDAGEKASELGQEIYLVGGVVRDLFLERPNFDLDLAVEGDAIKLAQKMARDSQAKLTVHARFGTAKLSYTDFSLDLATARRETYSQPGPCQPSSQAISPMTSAAEISQSMPWPCAWHLNASEN